MVRCLTLLPIRIEISSTLFGFDREPAGDGRVYQADKDDQCDSEVLYGYGMFGSGNSRITGYSGGASARPFITHHNALDIPFYLRIANELYLKRLIVGGFNGVFEFSRNFRNEGMDRTHNPEFTCMEVYVPYKDYLWMMDSTERMIEAAALAVNGPRRLLSG